jgi:hypothetical protein
VVGAGIFGCTISLAFANDGYDVALFEKEESFLKGGTKGSIFRLHSGAHYPRHLPTAIQSRLGMQSFTETFGDAVNRDFSNVYAVMKEGSRVNRQEFQDFLNTACIPHEVLKIPELDSLSIETSRISGAWKIPEGVVDIIVLRELIQDRFSATALQTHFSTRVTEIAYSGTNRRLLICDDGTSLEFDFIIIADYGMNEIAFTNISHNLPTFEYQTTAILKFRADLVSVGVTLMDGDFLTFLPNGFVEKSYLAYGPRPSLLQTATSASLLKLSGQELEERKILFRSKIMSRISDCFPNIGELMDVDLVMGYRSIPANSRDTDKRPSRIEAIDNSIFRVHSGKIDHAVDLAYELLSLVKSSS